MNTKMLSKCIKVLDSFKCKDKKGNVDYHFKNLDEETKVGIIMIMEKVSETLKKGEKR